jgi:hypothetical protein
MSLVVVALLVGGGALAVSALLTRRRRSTKRPEEPPALPAPELSGFPVALGDVISVAGEEAWLEQGWLLEEAGAAVAAVLFAGDVIVLALPSPRSVLYWLSAASPPSIAGEPPPSLDVDGEHFERARRIPVAVRTLGRAADPPWDSALLAEYRALGGVVLWMLARDARAICWSGRRVEDSDLENWGGGSSTLGE